MASLNFKRRCEAIPRFQHGQELSKIELCRVLAGDSRNYVLSGRSVMIYLERETATKFRVTDSGPVPVQFETVSVPRSSSMVRSHYSEGNRIVS